MAVDETHMSPTSKRRRLMEEEEDDELNESDVLPEIDGSQMALSPVATQDEGQGTKVISGRRSVVDDGVIEKILLVDFMCHKKLEVPLNPCVNFILGQNGSGKSAIMMAITVALGGKATATQRGQSLKNFIRTGCHQAEVHLTLNNRGSEAYKAEEYGKSITVVRTIRRDGSTSYKLKASNGIVVSYLKDDLLSMLDHFNIQVDNPVCMLSQDTSRHFLHSSAPGAKFKLFMKGTHLEKIAQDFAQAKEQQELMKREIERKIAMLPELQLRAKECENEVQEIDNLISLEEKERLLSFELLWAAVKECENKADLIEKDLNKEKRTLTKIDNKINSQREEEQNKRSYREEKSKVLKKATDEVQGFGAKKDELNDRKRVIDKEVQGHLNRIRSLQSQTTQWRNEKIQFEEKLTEIRNKNPDDIKSQRESLKSRLEDIERELVRCEDKLKAAQHDGHKKGEERTNITNEHMRTKSIIDGIQQDVRDCQQSLNRLTSSDNPLSGFDPMMAEIVTALRNNQRQFKRLPIGPIGSFIKVKDQKWCFAIEICISFSNLCSFVVDNHEDENKFKAIVRDVLRRHPRSHPPPCITSRFLGRQYDVSRHVPSCQYPVLLDMIDVTDPDVFNNLVDMAAIDTTLLIENKDEARHVMDNPPRNAKMAFTIEGDQVFKDRYYSNKNPRPMGILHASKEASIEHQRQCLIQLKNKLETHQVAERRLSQDLNKKSEEQGNIKKYIMDIQRKKSRLNRSKGELVTQLEELDDANQDGDIATWEGEISELEDKIKGHEDKVKEIRGTINEKRERLRDIEAEKNELALNEEAVFAKVEQAKDEFQKASDALHKVTNTINDLNVKKQSVQNRIQSKTNHLEQEKEDIRLTIEAAEQNCPERIETNRKTDSIQDEIEKIQNILRKESHRRNDQERARQALIEAMDQFNKTESAIEREQQSLEALQSGLVLRTEGYKLIRQHIAVRACIYFKHFINRRGYHGTLKFDLEGKKLEIIVKVAEEQATKNIKSLSGGERSFSTVAFIMALWEAMESPFRCLDEFDVFMDLVNRRISMQLMLEGAENLRGKQFIFLTPQDMSSLGIKFPPSCSTLRLNPPDRTQTTLD